MIKHLFGSALPWSRSALPVLLRSSRSLHSSRPNLYQRLPAVQRTRFAKQGRAPPYRLVGAVFSLGGLYYVMHLERTETGRLRFIDVSEATEEEMGAQAAHEVYQEYRGRLLPPHDPRVQQIKRVVNRLIAASHRETPFQAADTKPTKWEVNVIEDPNQANAFVLPNGSIFVFTGILPVAANEDGLAAVLGHEMAHKLARHSAERLSGAKVTQFLLVLASLAGLDLGVSSTAFQLLLTLPNSRANESEADKIGLRLAAQACYDPQEAIHLWERMRDQHGPGSRIPGMLSTHPADEQRIKNMTKWLPEAQQISAEKCNTAAFRRLSNQAW